MARTPRRIGISAVGFGLAAALCAQAPAPGFGTQDYASEYVSVWDMQVTLSTAAWAIDVTNGFRYMTNPDGLRNFATGLHLPNGAVIRYASFDACDTSDGSVSVLVMRTGASGNTILTFADTGFASTPGCTRFTTFPIAETVDTENFNYWIQASNTLGNGTATIGSIRVYYQLQVSPGPGTASFGDVPTGHPFFQFVEALAASGITAGCGGGNYCPDNPLTRGQMAVFLAKALGLHWPTAVPSGAAAVSHEVWNPSTKENR